MFCRLKTDTKLYRAFVLCSSCLTLFLRALFILGTLPVLSNYYETRFDDRKLSSIIGSIQTGTSYMTAVPSWWLARKIGVGWVQIMGGLFPCIGMIGTAFSTQAWQALIFNGIITGFGSACLLTSCFTIMPMYFTKKDQVAPFVAVTVFLGLGVLLTAKTISFMTSVLGFQYCLVACGMMSLLNALTGVFYQVPDSQTNTGHQNLPPQIEERPELIKKGKSQGTLELKTGRLKTISAGIDRMQQDDVMIFGQAEQISENKLEAENISEKKLESEHDKADTNFETKLPADEQKLKEGKLYQMKNFIREHKLIPVLFVTGTFGYAGYAAYASIIADYAAFKLEIPQDDYDLGVTIQGVAMLVSGLIYTFLAKMFTLSSLAVFTLGNMGQAAAAFSMLFQPNLMQFYVLMAINGASTSLMWNSTFPRWVDLAGLKYATLLYMLESEIEGLFIMPTSILAAYLQVEVDINAGLYLAIGLFLCSVLMELPASIHKMISIIRRKYTHLHSQYELNSTTMEVPHH